MGYNPNEPRDKDGKWTTGGSNGATGAPEGAGARMLRTLRSGAASSPGALALKGATREKLQAVPVGTGGADMKALAAISSKKALSGDGMSGPPAPIYHNPIGEQRLHDALAASESGRFPPGMNEVDKQTYATTIRRVLSQQGGYGRASNNDTALFLSRTPEQVNAYIDRMWALDRAATASPSKPQASAIVGAPPRGGHSINGARGIRRAGHG